MDRTAKVQPQFWHDRANFNLFSVGNQDAEVKALRKMGYTGTLNDMRRAFYCDITGIDELTTAKARAENVSDWGDLINYYGKSRGDGDTSRIIKYGANSDLMNPDGFTSEVGGGYDSVDEDDGSVMYWEVNTPEGASPQFCFYLTLDQYGTREEMLKMLKSLKATIKTHDSEVYVFNNSTGLWDKQILAGGSMEYVELELIDILNDVIDSNNEINIGVIHQDAVQNSSYVRLEIDYFKLEPTFFKQMP